MSAKVIGINEVKRLLDGGSRLTLLDVRTPAEFARVHAVGARSMPLDSLSPATVTASRAGRDEPVYVICQSGGRAGKACDRLEAADVRPVFSIEGGMTAWERSGLPVERSGYGAISLERQVRIVAGSLVLVGSLLAWFMHPWFLALPAFVGGGLVFAGVSDTCGMGMVLAKMPWNRVDAQTQTQCSMKR